MVLGFFVFLTAAIVALFFSPAHAIALAVIALNMVMASYGRAFLDAFSIYLKFVRDQNKDKK